MIHFNLYKKYSVFFSLTLLVLYACKKEATTIHPENAITISPKLYTLPSKLENVYLNFNAPKAINRIADIENEYFNAYPTGASKYYGTQWYNTVGQSRRSTDITTVFEAYLLDKGTTKLDSMHCTIYAVEALKYGFGDAFKGIKKAHTKIWGDREYAGWSLGYLLVKRYNWNAYLFISKQSKEYKTCLYNFKKDKKYHVWRQPDIPLEGVFDMDDDATKIETLLNAFEFGWGFSEQGWHTWITRFNTLKECNWHGAPSKAYNLEGGLPLFLKTKFTNYRDYKSHVIIFPPKIQK